MRHPGARDLNAVILFTSGAIRLLPTLLALVLLLQPSSGRRRVASRSQDLREGRPHVGFHIHLIVRGSAQVLTRLLRPVRPGYSFSSCLCSPLRRAPRRASRCIPLHRNDALRGLPSPGARVLARAHHCHLPGVTTTVREVTTAGSGGENRIVDI